MRACSWVLEGALSAGVSGGETYHYHAVQVEEEHHQVEPELNERFLERRLSATGE